MALGNKDIMAKNISYYMEKHGVDRNKMCNDLNLPYMTVSDWINGKSYPRIDKIEMLANYFGVKKSDLVEEKKYGSDSPNIKPIYDSLVDPWKTDVYSYAKNQLEEQNKTLNSEPDEGKYKFLQEDSALYEVEVTEKLAAGDGYSYSEYNEKYKVYTDKDNLPRYDIASFVTGDSMTPKYNDGEVVLIQLGYDNIQGAVYAVDYNSKSYLKKVFFAGDRIRLVSINKKYKDIYIDLPVDNSTYLNIIGRVVDSFEPIKR